MAGRILIIKSNPMSFDLSAHMLKAFGYNVFSATGANEGVQAANRNQPDLIICEVELPSREGLENAHELRSLPAAESIPLIAITDDPVESGWEEIFDAGFDGCIATSADPEAFVARIERFLPEEKRAKPSAEASPAPRPIVSASHNIPPHTTLLVVDDVETNRHLVKCLLEPEGYAVLEARNVTEAYKIAEEHRPDAILSDINLGLETGYQLYQKLQEQSHLRRIPFILMSSTDRPPSEREDQPQFQSITFILRPTEARPLIEALSHTLKSKAA